MNTLRINEADIRDLKVASLPSRPTAPKSLGGRGYTATEVKEAFDKLPLYIIQKFNLLLDSIGKEGEGSVSASMPTGISEGHTLADMLSDIVTGMFASYLTVSGASLTDVIETIKSQTTHSLSLAVENSFKIIDLDESLSGAIGDIDSTKSRLDLAEEKIAENTEAIRTMTPGDGGNDLSSITIDCGSPKDLVTEEGEEE